MKTFNLRASRLDGTIGLATATYATAGVGLLTSVVLTRAMPPQDFGSYRFVIAVIGMTAIVTNLGLPYSAARLLTQRPPEEHSRIIAASLQLLLAAAVIGALVLSAFALATWTVLAVSHLLLLSAGLLWTTVLQRHFMYMLRGAGSPREIAIQTILPPTIILLLSGLLLLLLSEFRLPAILLITGGAYFVTHLSTSFRFRTWGQRHLSSERSDLMRMQRGTGIPIYKGALISVGVAEMVVVLGGASIGASAFGQFALAFSLAAPVATLPAVIGMVQFRNFSGQASLPGRLLILTTLRSAIVGLVVVCGGWFAFPLIFPEGFEDARVMFPFLSAALLAHGIGDYLNQFLQAKGQGSGIKWAAYSVGAVSIITGVIAIPLVGLWGLAITRITASGAYAVAMAVLIRRWNRAN